MSARRDAEQVRRLIDCLRNDAEDPAPADPSFRYLGLREIARGGMASVHRAWDPRMNREVALKIALPETARDPSLRARFAEEVYLSAALAHPNIVPVYDQGEFEGRPFLAMLLVDGGPLGRARTDLSSTLRIVADAARALDAAHQAGIVHRDIKPSNLLLDRTGRIFITDFGVARQSGRDSNQTAPGTVIGTPAYMSPEQARGETADARSDIYSLGATLYELAVGASPYAGADPSEVLEDLRKNAPPAPRRLRPDLPKDVDAIIRMAMDRDPAYRYPSALAFAEDIDRHLDGRRPLARPGGWWHPLQRQFVRHPLRSTAWSVALLLLAAGLYAGLLLGLAWESVRKAEAEPNATLKRRLLEEAPRWYLPARRLIEELERKESADREVVRKSVKELGDRIHQCLRAGTLAEVDALLPLLKPHDPARHAEISESLAETRARQARADALAAIREALDRKDPEAARVKLGALPANDSDRADLDRQIAAIERERLIVRLEKAADSAAFEKLLAQAPAGPDERIGAAARALGLKLAEAADWKAVQRLLTEAERRGGKDWRLYEQRGRAALELRDWDAAQTDLVFFLQHSPMDTRPPAFYWTLWSQRAAESARANRWADAFRFLDDALALNPSRAMLHHDRGIAQWHLTGKPELALDNLREALRLAADLKPDPAWTEILGAAVRAEIKAGSDRALPLLDLGLSRIAPGDAALLLERARVLRRLRRHDEAAADAQALPDSPQAFLLRAQIRWSKDGRATPGLLADAERAGAAPEASYWRGLGRSDPSMALEDFLASGLRDAALRAGEILAARKETEKAVEQFGFALRDAPLSEDERIVRTLEDLTLKALLGRARAFAGLGRATESLADADRAIKLKEDSAEAHYLRGYVLHLRNAAAAVADLDRAIQLDSNHAGAHSARGTVRADLKDLPGAIEDYGTSIRLGLRSPENYGFRGRVRHAAGDLKGAQEDYEKALELAPPDWPHRKEILDSVSKLR